MLNKALTICFGAYVALLSVFWAFVAGTLFVLPFAVLPRGRRERFTRFGARLWFFGVVYGIVLARPRVHGRVDLAAGQGALFVCNHRSFLDPPLLGAFTGSVGLSKRLIALFPFIGLYGWLAGLVFVSRKSAAERRRARAEAVWLLSSGHRLFVFPEGTRSRDGHLRERVHLVLLKDAFELGVPVVPCAVWDTEHAIPPGGLFARPLQEVHLHIGQALEPANFTDAEVFTRAVWSAVASALPTR